MKKFLLLFVSLFGLTQAWGQAAEVTPTDIDALDDAIYVVPVTAAPGSQATLSICMKNSADNIAGFEFLLKLPEGITVATDGDGMLMAELSEERTTARKTNSFGANMLSTGLKVLCGTSAYVNGKLYTFSGHDGEVARITINVPADYAEGEYPMVITGGILSSNDATPKPYEFPDITTVLTIGEVVTVLDENSTTAPEATDGDVNILVKRTIKGGQWNTICLPFDMTQEQVYEAFGDDVQLQEFVGFETEEDEVSGDITKITVNFEDADLTDGFYGNYPYVIKTSKDITEFRVTATIDPDEENATAVFDNGKRPTSSQYQVYGTLYGTYHAQTVVPENCLFLSGGNFWYSTGKTKMKAFRAYFDLEDVLADLTAAGANVSMNFDTPTGIRHITDTAVSGEQSGFYTLDGVKLNGTPTKKGVYIHNGKKVVK